MDLRMTPYSCLATGNQVGIIEFVHNAKTVYNIQRQANRFAAMQFDSSQLYKWIKEVSQKVWYIKRININVIQTTLDCKLYMIYNNFRIIDTLKPHNSYVNVLQLLTTLPHK